MNKKSKIIIFVSIFILLTICVIYFYPLRSYAVMSLYTKYNCNMSVMEQKGFDIDMKGGSATKDKDWYPFVNIYDTSYEFSEYMDENISLTVLYNFGAFKGSSSLLFDESSKYFAAFYGAYAISYDNDQTKRYGFDGELVNIAEIAEVPLFDYKYLVIQDLGCKEPVFDITGHETKYGVSYVGYDGWVRIDARMRANSPSHTKKEAKLGYIQYGRPQNNGKKDFFEIELFGRMYARYFQEYGCTIVIYVMGADEEMIAECDKSILSKTVIKDKEKCG